MNANDLADRLDEHAAYDLLTPEDVDTMRAAAVLLREQAEQLDIQTALATNYAGKAVEYKQEKERAEEQLDTLRNAIGDPDNLRLLARTFDLPILARIAAAVPQDPETCACGKPATGTVGGVPTCGDDR